MSNAGKVLFWIWACVFVAGAAAQLLGVDGLAKLTDVKQLFLR